MRRFTFTVVALAAAVVATRSPSSATALTDAELKCQHAIGDVAHQFADHKLKAIMDCNNDVTDTGICDTARRDRRVASMGDLAS